jgi:predicted ATPase/class 3 adenylate cyclase
MHRVVPELILENYTAGRYGGEFPATGMFLDLSGFSSMTDTLMRHGQHGAEVLAGLMHGVFDPLVESIFEYGGKIVSFAGDGIMALFPIEGDDKGTALRALASASIIQQRLAEDPVRQTVYGKFSFTVKIGLAVGSVTWRILRSDEGDQATYYFRGSAVEGCADAEHHASAGEIVLTDAMNELLRDSIRTRPLASFHRFARFRIEPPGPSPNFFPPIDLDAARVFMPEEVIVHDVRGEFRQIVNLFMRIPELSDSQLNDFIRAVFDLRRKYGGLLTRLDFGDKGCNMLLLWGAPVAYENDIGRALNFVLELQSRLQFPVTAGVTYYIAHAGYLGSELCEDYTCYGWGVNLASRFMMNAPAGEIWVDERIARRVSARFDVEYIGSQKFKGFAAEQKVNVLRGRKRDFGAIYLGEMVGRDAELARLGELLEPLWRREFAGVHLIVGDAGIGKGRLVHELISSPRLQERRVLWAVCQSDQVLRKSFNPLRGWLMRYFGIPYDSSPEECKAAFDSRLEDLLDSLTDPDLKSELERVRSFLAALLDINIPGSLYEQLDAEGRHNNTLLALIALFRAESLRQPVVLMLEDLHFTDEETIKFLPRFKRALLAGGKFHPIAILITSRPHGLIETLDADLVDSRMDLAGLPPESVRHLAEIALGGSVAPGLVALLAQRSEGNPYFVEQIIRYLQEESLLEMSAEGWMCVKRLREVFVPGDIRSILIARLDQLTREVRDVVHTASVLGREFEVRTLLEMLQGDDRFRAHILEAEKAAIWAPLDALRYIFSHGLLRDAAYSMQMRARRRELHALAAQAMERLYASDLEPHFAELAYHAEHADLRPQAQKYYLFAGRQSASLFQNNQAAEYFTYALAFTPFDDLNSQFDLLIERASVYAHVGDRTLQLNDLDSLEKLARQLGDNKRTSIVETFLARYYFSIGDYPAMIARAERAVELNKSSGDAAAELDVYVVWSLGLLRQGKLDSAMQIARKGLELAQMSGQHAKEGHIYNAMGLIALEWSDPTVGRQFFDRAVAIARATRDLRLELMCLNNLGNSAGYVQHDYPSALDYYEQAYEIAHKHGDRIVQGAVLTNLGWVAGMLGDFESARSYHGRSLVIAREVRNIYHETYALINLSAIAGVQGRAQESLEYARSAYGLSVESGERSGEAWSLLYEGYALLLLGELGRAQDAFMRSISIREELGQPSLMMEPVAGLIDAALAINDDASALEHAERILAHFANDGTLEGAEEPLRVFLACYRALEKNNDPRSKNLLRTAFDFLESQVSNIRGEEMRHAYVVNVPWRLAIRDAWRAAQDLQTINPLPPADHPPSGLL